jgi:hypothetical protein
MKRALFISAAIVFFVARSLLGAEQVTIQGSIVNHKGEPFAGVAIHAFGIIGIMNDAETNLTVRSDATGYFSFTVPSGLWLIRVDPEELLVRGYACFPDYSQPVFMDVKLEAFEVIPTRPLFSTPKLVEGKIQHTITFDTPVAPILTIRTYEVQSSSDHVQWKTFASVSLLNSPFAFEDADTAQPRKFYRAILIENEEEVSPATHRTNLPF